MKIQFLQTSLPGLRWMRRYYRDRPELKESAAQNYQKAKILLRDAASSGRMFEDMEGVLERRILNTPFSIIYAIKDDTAYVIDIRDGRGLRSEKAMRLFARELREATGSRAKRRLHRPRNDAKLDP